VLIFLLDLPGWYPSRHLQSGSSWPKVPIIPSRLLYHKSILFSF